MVSRLTPEYSADSTTVNQFFIEPPARPPVCGPENVLKGDCARGGGRSGRRVTVWRGCGHVPTPNRWSERSARRGGDHAIAAAPHEGSAGSRLELPIATAIPARLCDEQRRATRLRDPCRVLQAIEDLGRSIGFRSACGHAVQRRCCVKHRRDDSLVSLWQAVVNAPAKVVCNGFRRTCGPASGGPVGVPVVRFNQRRDARGVRLLGRRSLGGGQ